MYRSSLTTHRGRPDGPICQAATLPVKRSRASSPPLSAAAAVAGVAGIEPASLRAWGACHAEDCQPSNPNGVKEKAGMLPPRRARDGRTYSSPERTRRAIGDRGLSLARLHPAMTMPPLSQGARAVCLVAPQPVQTAIGRLADSSRATCLSALWCGSARVVAVSTPSPLGIYSVASPSRRLADGVLTLQTAGVCSAPR